MGHLENISVQVEQDQISGSTFTYKDKNRSSEPYRFEIRFQDIEKVTYKNRKLHFLANNQLVTLYDLPGLDELYRTIRKKIEENREGGHV